MSVTWTTSTRSNAISTLVHIVAGIIAGLLLVVMTGCPIPQPPSAPPAGPNPNPPPGNPNPSPGNPNPPPGNTNPPPVCGNGIKEQGELCDDGNFIDDDGCNSLCQPPRCGNGIRDLGEQCDDGNRINGDGCESNCTITVCPPRPVPTVLLHLSNESAGSNCFHETKFVNHYPVHCSPGMKRAACDPRPVDPGGDTSCTFVGWTNPADETDCGCDIEFRVPQDCSKHITCEVTISQIANAPPRPPFCGP